MDKTALSGNRIVSLVPSLTQTLYEYGYSKQLVGCTSYCSQPQKGLQHVTRVGGTKNPDISIIKSLQPTHILMNKEENRIEDFNACKNLAEVITTYPKHPYDVPHMLNILAETFQDKKFQALGHSIQKMLQKKKVMHPLQQALYFIWKDPWMIANSTTYIGGFMEQAGYDIHVQAHEDYPFFDIKKINPAQTRSLFFSSEPWPFRKRDIMELRHLSREGVRFFHINGIFTSWHGIATQYGLQEIQKWKNNEKNNLIKEWFV